MKELLLYIKEKKSYLILLIFYLAAVSLIYGLYGLAWGPAQYTCILTGTVTLVYLAVDFIRWRRKWKILEIMKGQAGNHLDEELFPLAGTPTEERYQELLKIQEKHLRDQQEENRLSLKKAREYYTRWNHQIKTPIAAMELLLQEEPADVRALNRELLKTRQYVEMALSYQRIEGEENDLVIQEYALKSMVMQAVKKVGPLFIHKKISLKLDDLSGQILTDEKWLVFVLEQLLTNAAKYTGEGGQVTIGKESGDKLIIWDTGIGIRSEDLPRIFDWGYTGYNGRLDKRSTGIGLTLVKSAMDMLGHGIEITSQIGEGTKVTLELGRKPLEVE